MFDKFFSNLPLKPHQLTKLKKLITLRIATPASKLRTSCLASDYGIDLKVDSIYKLMDELDDNKIKLIKNSVYENSTKLLSEQKMEANVLFYDLTTLYFETNSDGELRKNGFSKDGKHQHVQLVFAMIVTNEGLPINYSCFPGNTYEGHTLIPVLNQMKEQYNISRIVLVADSALMNKVNLEDLKKQDYEYIIAARVRNSPKEIKNAILAPNDYSMLRELKNKDGEIIDTTLSKVISTEDGDSIISYFSTKRARKDAFDREKTLEKIRNYLGSSGKSKLTSQLRKSYVKVSKGADITIDEDKLAKDKEFDGYFAIRTNIKNPDHKDILLHYKGLWQIEQSFRISKHNLEIRPIYHYTDKRILAHLVVCYLSLALVRYVEFILKVNEGIDAEEIISIETLNILLHRMRKVQLTDSYGKQFELLEDPPPELTKIYQALAIKSHKKFANL